MRVFIFGAPKDLMKLFLAMAALGGLAGCRCGSSNYQYLKDLPYSEWNRYAASLPIEQALDLQKEIRERSGHNPLMTIDDAFSERPLETYKSIVRRIQDGDTSHYYLGVIYDIDGSQGFKICSQPDRSVIQNYLSGIVQYPEHWKYQPDFYDC